MANSAIPRDDAGRFALLRHLNTSLPGMADLPGISPDMLAHIGPRRAWKHWNSKWIEATVSPFTYDTHHGHLDTAPFPPDGTTALWRYRGIYRLKIQRVGQWNAVLEVAEKAV